MFVFSLKKAKKAKKIEKKNRKMLPMTNDCHTYQ